MLVGVFVVMQKAAPSSMPLKNSGFSSQLLSIGEIFVLHAKPEIFLGLEKLVRALQICFQAVIVIRLRCCDLVSARASLIGSFTCAWR